MPRSVARYGSAASSSNERRRDLNIAAAPATRWWRGSAGSDPVDPLAGLVLLRGDLQPTLLLQRPADRTPDRVLLPAGSLDHLGDGRTFGPAQHGDQHGLLGASRERGRRGSGAPSASAAVGSSAKGS